MLYMEHNSHILFTKEVCHSLRKISNVILQDIRSTNMKIQVVSSLFFTICVLTIFKAEVSATSYLSKTRQAYSPLASRAEQLVDGDLKSVDSVYSTTLAPNLSKRSGKRRPWSPEELKLLVELREERKLPWNKINEFFPQRGWQALKTRYSIITRDSNRIKKKVKPWTHKERDALLKLKKTGLSWREIAEHIPGRSPMAVKRKYQHLHKDVKVPKAINRKWSAKENKLILKLAEEGVPWKERVKYFDNRSMKAVKNQFSKLMSPNPPRYGNYTPEEDDEIAKALELGMTIEQIAQLLDRNIESVGRRIKILRRSNRLKLAPQIASGRPYSVADIELMHEMRDRGMTWDQIATRYFPGRSKVGVRQGYKNYQKRQKEQKKKKGNG